ncbi:hypothetical protein ACQYWY_21595 [Comamonas sediminis]|uniref:hypothetical protein n=1 Tax=Comamonas sediminis TaxID=1783360 RepID=UPI003D2AB4BD
MLLLAKIGARLTLRLGGLLCDKLGESFKLNLSDVEHPQWLYESTQAAVACFNRAYFS